MFVQVEDWKNISWLRHGFSTRSGGVTTVYQASPRPEAGGDLNLGWTKDDDPAHVAENRRRLIAAVGAAASSLDREAPPLITVRQVHSNVSLVVPKAAALPYAALVDSEGRALREADGLITAATGVLLGIQTADCVPVFVVDRRLRVVANFHAGWRGTAARIVELGVAKMIAEFGSRPDELMAAIGPSIGACCYSVGEEVREAFTHNFTYGRNLFEERPEGSATHYLDLWEANRRQLLDSGISDSHISLISECSGCAGLPVRRRYFSHRCEQGFTGRMMSVIGVVDEADQDCPSQCL